MNKILIIEDDADINVIIAEALTKPDTAAHSVFGNRSFALSGQRELRTCCYGFDVTRVIR